MSSRLEAPPDEADGAEEPVSELVSSRSEGLYRGLFEHAHDAILVLDPDGERVLEVNRRACELYGYSREQFLGLSIRDMAPRPADHKTEEVIRVGHVDTFETMHRRADGSNMYLEVNGAMVDFDGRPAILSINRDVSARREAEQELVRFNRRLSMSKTIDGAVVRGETVRNVSAEAVELLCSELDAERASVVMYDFDARVAWLLAETGVPGVFSADGTDSSLLAQWRIELDDEVHDVEYVPDLGALESLTPRRQRLLEKGVHSVLTVPLVFHGRRLGELNLASRKFDAFDRPSRDFARAMADDLVVAVDGAQSREALEVERERLKSILDHLPEGVVLLDSEARLSLANKIGRDYLRTLAHDSDGGAIRALGHYSLEELADAVERTEISGSGNRYFSVQVLRVDEPGGRTSGYVLVLRDTTDDREIQAKVREHDRLAAVGQLAAGIAHDFNNLLQTVSTCVELALEDDGAGREQLETIRDQSRRGALLIRQILDFSRRSISTRAPTDLRELLASVGAMLRHSIPESISVGLNLGTKPLFAEVDPAQIQQVVTNLCVNARDAMPRGGRLTISLFPHDEPERDHGSSRSPEPGNWVAIRLTDTGEGIPDDVLPHIFEPFFTTKTPDHGTGLGLSQVYGIVQQHEGCLDVDSHTKGTVVTAYFKRLDGFFAKSRSSRPPSSLPRGNTQRVLLVEDDAVLRRSLERLVSRMGYRVLVAADGEEGMRVFNEHRDDIDMVLTDMVMPRVGGVELCRRIREQAPDLPVVIMSGYPLEQEGRKLISEGVNDWIGKPFSKEQIARVLAKAVDKRERAKGEPEP